MQGMIDRQEIKDALPYGGLSKIARRTGVKPAAVTKWFSGRINSERIQNAAIELYAETVAAHKAVAAKLEAAKRGEKL